MWPVRPVLRALSADLALPSADFGPVLFRALARLAARRRSLRGVWDFGMALQGHINRKGREPDGETWLSGRKYG